MTGKKKTMTMPIDAAGHVFDKRTTLDGQGLGHAFCQHTIYHEHCNDGDDDDAVLRRSYIWMGRV